jgi:hypothetical protein
MRASEKEIYRKNDNGESIKSEDRFAHYVNRMTVRNTVDEVAAESGIKTIKEDFDEKVSKLKLAGIGEDAAIKATEEAEKITEKGVAMDEKPSAEKPQIANNKSPDKDMDLSFLS